MSDFEYLIENKLYYLIIVKDEIAGLGFEDSLTIKQVHFVFNKLVEEEEEFMEMALELNQSDKQKLKDLFDKYHELFCCIVEILFDINDALCTVHENLFY
ncbi:unnamed protein product [Dimorphilus gyrociliatus]|uniref:Uncharacterized protein n=1 Tax=Dimorphilus gyrociliatus TaxID=2664684 RepID=A0A7I8WFP3_9ANNE|nr:unnamed protein product [Dimorphilus gyrociliatus]